MKVLSLLTLSFMSFFFLSCTHNSKDRATDIAGSETLLELTQIQAEAFYKEHKKIITLTGGGSGVGITMLLDKQTDIANLSRDVKKEEWEEARKKGIEMQEIPIAVDMLTVIVHKDNPLTNITPEQLKEIYLGNIKNWKEVGGPDLPISLYGRQSSSGTYQFFQELVLEKKDFSQYINEMTGNPQIILSLKVDKGGIAYVGLGYAIKRKQDVKILKYDGINPEEVINTPRQNEYKLHRHLIEVIDQKKPSQAIDDWFEFILSKRGDKLVEEGGFLPLPANEKRYIKTVKEKV